MYVTCFRWLQKFIERGTLQHKGPSQLTPKDLRERDEILLKMKDLLLEGQHLGDADGVNEDKRMWVSLMPAIQECPELQLLHERLSALGLQTVESQWREMKRLCPGLGYFRNDPRKARDASKVMLAAQHVLGMKPYAWESAFPLVNEHRHLDALKGVLLCYSEDLLRRQIFIDAGTVEPLHFLRCMYGIWEKGMARPICQHPLFNRSVCFYNRYIAECLASC